MFRRRPLTNFDMWMFVIVMALGRLAELAVIAAGLALIFGFWKP